MLRMLPHTIAHGQRKQNILHLVLFSGKWEACLLVHNPECGQGFGNLKWRSPLRTSTQHHLPRPSLQLRDTGAEDVGRDWGAHTRCTKKGEAEGEGEGLLQAVSKAALHRGRCSIQVPRLLFVAPCMKERMRLKEDDATCSVYPMADEL